MPIPKYLRERLPSLIVRRAELNKRPQAPLINCGAWHREAAPVFAEIKDIEDKLRELANAPLPSCLDYYAGWEFRCSH